MRTCPRWTLAFLIAIPALFGLQFALAPAACAGRILTAYCATVALLKTSISLALLLIPFLHGTLRQFLLKVVLFADFGGAIEHYYGRNDLLWLFVLGGYISTAVQIQAKLMRDAPPISIGSRGGVAALMGFFVVMQFPRSKAAVLDLVNATTHPKTILRPILPLIGLILVAEIPLQHVGLLSVDP